MWSCTWEVTTSAALGETAKPYEGNVHRDGSNVSLFASASLHFVARLVGSHSASRKHTKDETVPAAE